MNPLHLIRQFPRHLPRPAIASLAMMVLLVIAVWLLPTPSSKANDKAEYSLWAWITMLYSTGMGAGLLLRAVQEPVFYLLNPPVQVDYAPQHLALQYTFFHLKIIKLKYKLVGKLLKHKSKSQNYQINLLLNNLSLMLFK